MFKIATIINNDLQELKDEVNKYCSRNPYVVAVIKYTYNLRGD